MESNYTKTVENSTLIGTDEDVSRKAENLTDWLRAAIFDLAQDGGGRISKGRTAPITVSITLYRHETRNH